MMEKHHVYLLKSGRLSIPCLNKKNVKLVAKAIHDVVVNK